MISAIVCVDKNWGIGSNGDLLVHIPEDMKYFKRLTTGHVVVMGRRTWESLPNKPLPDRLNLVVTSRKRTIDFMTISIGIEEALVRAIAVSKDPEDEWFVIGGGQLYKELLPICNKVYVTKVYHAYPNVDTYFPNIDNAQEWEVESASEIKEHNQVKYQFCIYRKKDIEQ